VTTIVMDPGRALGHLDRRVFGGFVEHLGRCIYGGLYEEDSLLSDEHGFRTDVLGLLKDLRLSVLRWRWARSRPRQPSAGTSPSQGPTAADPADQGVK
jgi:hypothetical protein